MRVNRFLILVAAALLAALSAHADGVDGHVVTSGGPGGSPSCTSFQSMTAPDGTITPSETLGTGECEVTGITATTIAFAILNGNSNGGLSESSPLTSIFPTTGTWGWLGQFNWTLNCTNGTTPGAIDKCLLTAPTQPTGELWTLMEQWMTQAGIINDGDCDIDDFIFGIPVGCDITFTTTLAQPFVGDVKYDASTNGSPLAPLPEPGSLSLVLVGLAGLPILRRKFAR